jgi:hypothetical protein
MSAEQVRSIHFDTMHYLVLLYQHLNLLVLFYAVCLLFTLTQSLLP